MIRRIAWLGLWAPLAACPYNPTLGEAPGSTSSGSPTTGGPASTGDAVTTGTTATGTTAIAETDTGGSTSVQGSTGTGGATGSTGPATICGDGMLDDGEACDDGNTEAGDLCSKTCEPTKIVDLAPGASHTCVVFESGELRCWGTGWLGYPEVTPLGDEPGELPTPAIAVGGKVIEASAGDGHTCVRLDNLRVRCWGANDDGQLGYGDMEARGDAPGELPTPDVELVDDIDRVVLGQHTSCTRTGIYTLRCWGSGESGVLGTGNTMAVGDAALEMPPGEVDGVYLVDDLDVGRAHACAVHIDGTLSCWGWNAFGLLGAGHMMNIGDAPGEMPPPPVDIGAEIVQVGAGELHNCALTVDQKVRCFGQGAWLGYGTGSDIGDSPAEMPPADVDVGGPVERIAVGWRHTCALLTSGKVRCWGHNDHGQLGYAHTNQLGDGPGEMPTPDVDLGGDAVMIAAHHLHTCALLTDGSLRCWGFNGNGQLGYGHTKNIGDDETPASAGPVPF